MAKPIHEIIPFEREDSIVLYVDGTCESLELAIDTRKQTRDDTSICHKPVIADPESIKILKTAYFRTSDGRVFLTYFTRRTGKNDIYLIRLRIEPESLQIMDTVTKIRIARVDPETELKGYAVVNGLLGANLITICMLHHYWLSILLNAI